MEIKNLVGKLINQLAGSKNKILNIGLIILTVIIASNMYRNKAKDVQLLNAKKDTELKKNSALEQIKQLEKSIESYKNIFNKKDASLIINTINNIARDSNVKIISIKPSNERKESVYTSYPFLLTVSADNYHCIGKFISGIESHPDIYFVDAITITIEDIRQAQNLEQGLKPITRVMVNLTLSKIVFKD